MSRPPKIFSAEANRELSRRLNRQCCWKIPKMLNFNTYHAKMLKEIVYFLWQNMENKLSVWRNNKSEWRVWSSYLIWWGLIYKPGSLCVVETAEIWKIQIWKKGRDMFQQWQTAGRVSHTTENSNKRNRKYYCLRQHKSLKMLPP